MSKSEWEPKDDSIPVRVGPKYVYQVEREAQSKKDKAKNRKKEAAKKKNAKKLRRQVENQKRAAKKRKANSIDFFKSQEWRELRYKVIKEHGGDCMACGRNKKDHGVVIHVDHIKPRLKYPKLELEISNLQILCEDCNVGKSYKDQTNWRPKKKQT